MSVEWSVRECTQGDIPQVYELAKVAFDVPVTFSYEHIIWLFSRNPTGEFRGWVAHVGDKLVGFYGVIPADLYFLGRRVRASHSLLTMTHPGYRRQGMFQTLASALYGQLAEQGIAITFGFPNENSLPGFVSKLGWAHIGTLDIYARPLNPAAVVRQIAKSDLASTIAGALFSPIASGTPAKPASGLGLREVPVFDSRVNSLVDAHRERRIIQQVRSQEYLNWRYAMCPDWRYRIVIAEEGETLVGYSVLRCMSEFGLSGGMIMDMSALPGRSDVLLALIRDSVIYSRESGMDLVACLMNGAPEAIQALRRSWFIKVPRRFSPKKWYFGARLNNDQLSAKIVNDSHHWLLTFGDNDPI